jgi:hypothetical protein
VVPFPKPRAQIADAKHFRSTWLTASQATIRARGYGARYEAAIDREYRDRVLALVAGVWMPMEIARAHYTACDRLDLPTAELVDIGKAATQRANATTLSFMSRLAKGSGATPWTVLAQTPRLVSATADDGAVAVARLGPKEARVEFVGYPLAGIRYNRITMQGIVLAVVELLCKKAYVKEIASMCSERCLGMRVSWV